MGFLEAIFGGGKLSESAPRQDLARLAEGGPSDVAGESFYSSAFKQIAKRLDKRQGDEVIVDIELRLDPNNKYSKSGKAVGVHVLGLKVGHVPSADSSATFDTISQRGNAASCKGRVFFDDFGESSPRHSVVLFIDSPTRFEGEEKKPKRSASFSRLDENEQSEIELKIEARKRGEGPPLPELKRGNQVCPEGVKGFDLNILEKVLAAHTIHVRKIPNPDLYVVLKPDTWDDSSAGLEKVIINDRPSVYYNDFFDKYPNLSPSPEMQEAIGAAREWLQSSPGDYESEIALVARARKEGHVLLRGHAILASDVRTAGGAVTRVASYEARVMKDHRANLKSLLVGAGARVYDKLLVVGDLSKDREKNRIYVSVANRQICAMYAEQREYFDIVDRRPQEKQKDLVEIYWQAEDEIKVNVFSFQFHY
jgi:hypothetical protein